MNWEVELPFSIVFLFSYPFTVPLRGCSLVFVFVLWFGYLISFGFLPVLFYYSVLKTVRWWSWLKYLQYKLCFFFYFLWLFSSLFLSFVVYLLINNKIKYKLKTLWCKTYMTLWFELVNRSILYTSYCNQLLWMGD